MKKPQIKKSAKKSVSTKLKVNEYTSLIFKGVTYSIGDVAYIRELNDDDCLGTILSLRQTGDNIPQVHIRWFYKPSDVFSEQNPCFSSREFFDSDHKQVISSDCLYGLARVVSYEEFFSCDVIDKDLFFTRACYKSGVKKLEPAVENWPRVCTCRKIANPDNIFKKCLGCGEAFHIECLKSEICPKCHSADLIDYDYMLVLEEEEVS